MDTVDSHKQTHSRNVDRYRTTVEFTTTRINRCVQSRESDYVDVSVYECERREGVTVTILTIVIFIDEWHPVTQEGTRNIQQRPLCTSFGERFQFGPVKNKILRIVK